MKKIALYVLGAISLCFTLSYFFLSTYRANLKLPHRSYEDATLQITQMILDGIPEYREADAYFIPTIYGPLLHLATAPFVALTKNKLLGLRLPSLITIALLPFIFFLILRLLRRRSPNFAAEDPEEKNDFWYVLLFAGLFYSAYYWTGKWLDLGKVDSIFLFLMLSLLYFALRFYYDEGIGNLAALGLIAALIILTKQSGGILLAASGLLVLYRGGFFKGVLYGVLALAFFGLYYALFLRPSGWYYFLYNWIIPGTHFLRPENINKAALPFVGGIALVALYFVLEIGRKHWRERSLDMSRLAPAVFFLCLMAISVMGRMKMGAVENSWLYLTLGAAVLIPLELRRGRALLPTLAIALAIFVHFALVVYNPLKIARKISYQYRVQDRFIQVYCSLGGSLLDPIYPYLGRLYCGHKKTSFGFPAAIDIIFHEEQSRLFLKSLDGALKKDGYEYLTTAHDFAVKDLIKYRDYTKGLIRKAKSERKRKHLLLFMKSLDLEIRLRRSFRKIENPSPLEKEFMKLYRGTIKYNIILLRRQKGSGKSE